MDYSQTKGSETMKINAIRCQNCNRLLLNRLSGDMAYDNSTNMLSLVPKDDDLVLEIKCPRCKKYSVIFKLGVDINE